MGRHPESIANAGPVTKPRRALDRAKLLAELWLLQRGMDAVSLFV